MEFGDVLLVFSGLILGILDINMWWVCCGVMYYSWNVIIIYLLVENLLEY